MKEEYSLKYISNRIMVLAAVIFDIFLAYTVYHLVIFCRTGEAFWKTACGIFLTGAYLAVIWFWIVIPYRRSEKWMKRFLDGYILSDTEDIKSFFVTPSMSWQVEMLNRLMKSPHMMDLNKRQAQYLALQNQINPHFLYNTLESIRGEALIAGLDNVADMTEALAKFFRYTITKVENLVTVEEELDNCDTYFRIQKYRFGDRLNLHVKCAEEDYETVMNCRIPKLTLQPILENSIIHGTEVKVGTGNLCIQFERTEQRLIVRISDDGVGMDETTLAELNRRLGKNGNSVAYQNEGKKGGIALVNVNNRIHLLFGEEYGMHVYSIPEKGTDVEITIPIGKNAGQIEAEAFQYERRSFADGAGNTY